MDKKGLLLMNRLVSFLKWYLEHKAKKYIMVTFCEAGLVLLSPNIIIALIVAFKSIDGDLSFERSLDSLSYIGIGFIILGPILHYVVFAIVKYKIKNYKYICDMLSSIFKIYDVNQFEEDFISTYDNCRLFSNQLDKIFDLCEKINDYNFSLKNKQYNKIVKKFGKDLESFNSYCSLQMYSYNEYGDVKVPPDMASSVNKRIYDNCCSLIEEYKSIWELKKNLEEENFSRFFV
jgi:hypothetical protein